MKHGTQVALGPGHNVLDRDPVPPPSKGHIPQFSAHICCGQMAGSIKMPLGTEVGLGPKDIALDGDTAPLPQNGQSARIFGPCRLWPSGWMDQDVTWCEDRPWPRTHCARWRPSSPSPKRGDSPQLSAHVCCGQTVGWIKMPLGMEVGLGPGYIVLNADPAPPQGDSFQLLAHSVAAKQLDGSRCHLVRRYASAQATLCYMGTQFPRKEA